MTRWTSVARFTFRREAWWLMLLYGLLPLAGITLAVVVPLVARLLRVE